MTDYRTQTIEPALIAALARALRVPSYVVLRTITRHRLVLENPDWMEPSDLEMIRMAMEQ
jgi:hypothetical protein